jgi:hypothetical protein
MRKLTLVSGAEFPAPVHEGKSSIWHLAQVLMWLKRNKAYQIENTLLEIAQTNMQVNVEKELDSIKPGMRTSLG